MPLDTLTLPSDLKEKLRTAVDYRPPVNEPFEIAPPPPPSNYTSRGALRQFPDFFGA